MLLQDYDAVYKAAEGQRASPAATSQHSVRGCSINLELGLLLIQEPKCNMKYISD